MAMDIRLVKANDDLATIAFDNSCDSEEFEAAQHEYIEVFKVVAAERGEAVIAWENPCDYIMECIFSNGNSESIEKALIEFKRLVDALESIGYSNLVEWKVNYDDCVEAWNAVKQKG
jgi:hypothetical protein